MRPKIYLFGDSITESSFTYGGWGASLAHHFSRTVDVVLRGYSGYNTRWAVKVMERVLPAANAVAVFFGANDACLPDRCGAFQHVPLHEYKHNLHSINRWPNTLVLLITPPPIDEEARLKYVFTMLASLIHPYVENPTGLPERTNEAAGAYAKACIEVAGECGLPVVDLWTKMQQLADWKTAYLSDGLHLNETGNRVVFEEVVMKLKTEGLSLENLPVDLPMISEIDPNDPLKAFEG
ncbi:GDSL esterase/lipase [Citrus sinensis]|nr:GDSL esterase/lipase [Citrus sinensis]